MIKKFNEFKVNEKYEMNVDGNDIGEEYAKAILSEYFESGSNSLKEVFENYIKEDGSFEEPEMLELVTSAVRMYINDLAKQAKSL